MRGFKIKVRKCTFRRRHVKYLGHVVGCGRLAIPEDRVEVFRNMSRTSTKKGLKSFLGAIGFYRKFIDHFADYSVDLSPATARDVLTKVKWTERMSMSFVSLSDLLCSAACLFVPREGDVFVLYTDASGVGVAGCLHVRRWSDGVDEESPVAFFSRQLSPAERNYSTTEREALAIVSQCQAF